ncbi:acireductone synthase [Pseudomonas sp. F1_0610]|uniref:acireductone synthase n=1 Tax=Pseudomonas sp. F1_0610 TaxID=3114284 RepID=UPI0039C497AB
MISAIVTDIEGTTTSVSFVYKTLFPYAKAHIAEFLQKQQQRPDVAEQIRVLHTELGKHLSLEALIAQLIQWMEEDKKHTALKALQGMVWQQGYLTGEIKGHLYPDVLPVLEQWAAQGIALYVYSSGSVQAQKLLFSCSEQGDITSLFSGYFDTTIGAKREISAYRNISQTLDLPAAQILFLSDMVQELDAAARAGFKTIGLARDGASLVGHTTVNSFADINLSW